MADKRIEKTKVLIKDTFLSLSLTVPAEKITVKAICDKANINRGTFYYHYLDVPDLIEKLGTDAADRLAQAILKRYDFDGETSELLEDLFHCLKENPEDARLLFGIGSSRADKGLDHLYKTMRDAAMPHWRAKSNVTDVQLEVIFNHTMHSIFNLLRLWQSGQVNMEEKEFRELYGNIIIRGIYTYVYNELPVNDSPHETHNNTIGE